MNHNISIQQLTSDRDISLRYWLQICNLQNAITIDDKSKEELLQVVLEVIKKIESVKYHKDNLNRIINDELSSLKEAKKQGNAITVNRSTGVEKEMEAILMQGKATLDVLVKVLKPLSGIKLMTYGESGKRVIKALKNNLPQENLQRADWLIELVEKATPWIKQWVGSYRDTVAHYKCFESSGFVGIPDHDGNMQHQAPADSSGMPLQILADQLFNDLMCFCEDFLVFSYRIMIFKGFDIAVRPKEEQTEDDPTLYALYMVNYSE